MRTRKEIEDNVNSRSGYDLAEQSSILMLEVMLDVRELLLEANGVEIVNKPIELHLIKADQVKHMVDRFLQWKLPEDFSPDGGIQFDANAAIKINHRNHKYSPVGTNLLTATQAQEMVLYMLKGMKD